MYFHPAYVSGNGFEGEGASGVMFGTSVTVFAINTKGMETGAVPGAKSRAGMRLSEVASALCGPDLFLACRFPRRSPFPACRVATLRP